MLNRIGHDDDILEIRFERPPANALNGALIEALRDEVTASSREAFAIVLSGTPGMFSAGLDVPELLTLDRGGMQKVWTDFFQAMRAIALCPVPVVAAVTGHAPAGGAVLAIHADRRIMSEGKFKIGLNETQVGVQMPGFIHANLVRLVGYRRAEEMVVTGAMLTAEEALGCGLVDELAPGEETVQRALDWCRQLLKLPRTTMLETRRVARDDLYRSFADWGDRGLEDSVDAWFRDETQQALRALVARLAEKRA